MKVILREDVKNLGRAGDEVKVAEGFGRNYLLPKKLAVVATPSNQKILQQELNSKKGRERRVRLDAQYQAEAIAARPVVFVMNAGEGGKLFGSVTSADIEKELAKRGIEVDKRKIELEEPIKTLGTYTVSVKIHSEVAASLTVTVQAEAVKAEKAETPHTEAPAPAGLPTEAHAEEAQTEANPQ